MTEREIRYCMTSDGVRIAYTASGDSPHLFIHMPNGLNGSIQYDALPSRALWIEELSKSFTVIRYDNRGSGLSQREVEDISLEARVRDLEAVVEKISAERFVLFALLASGPEAIMYARDNPDRVSHLVLWPPPLTSDNEQRDRALSRMATADWDTFVENFAHIAWGWEQAGDAHQFAAIMREAVHRDTWWRWIRTYSDSWALAEEWAPLVNVPTLVMQRGEVGSQEWIARLVAALPDGALKVFPGTGVVPYLSDGPIIIRSMLDFVGVQEGAAEPPLPATERPRAASSTTHAGLTVILFADIVDSTALTEQLGDAAFRDKARDIDNALRIIIRDNTGTPIEGKLLGDGVLATFASAKQAIEAALACGRAGDEMDLPLHLGLHAGDVIREDNNVFGGAVNTAARVSALSAPGEVLVSGTVRDLARTSAGVSFEDRGEQSLKGVSEPVRVFRVVQE